jgi:hypothetical protein
LKDQHTSEIPDNDKAPSMTRLSNGSRLFIEQEANAGGTTVTKVRQVWNVSMRARP